MDNNKFWSKLWLYVPQHRVLWLEKKQSNRKEARKRCLPWWYEIGNWDKKSDLKSKESVILLRWRL